MKKLGIWSCILLVLFAAAVPGHAFAAEREQISIPVRVLTEGSEPDRNGVYTVELLAQTPGSPMPEGSTAGVYRLSLKGGSTGHIVIPCDVLGVFDYRIRQVPGTDSDCIYDEQTYRLRLYVTEREDGSLSASAMLYDREEEKQTEILFCNHWADPVYLTLSARKTMDGSTPKDGAFTFRLLSEDGKVLHEVKNKGRRVTFPALRFDREGTYRFFLKEVAGRNRKILYDRSVYTITVTVTKDTDYRTQVTYERNGKSWSGTPSFANYTDTGSPKTGDAIGIYITVLGLSTLALAVLLFRRKRR